MVCDVINCLYSSLIKCKERKKRSEERNELQSLFPQAKILIYIYQMLWEKSKSIHVLVEYFFTHDENHFSSFCPIFRVINILNLSNFFCLPVWVCIHFTKKNISIWCVDILKVHNNSVQKSILWSVYVATEKSHTLYIFRAKEKIQKKVIMSNG